MRRLLALVLILPVGMVAAPEVVVGATKKRGCSTLKTSKARSACKAKRKSSKLRKGQVCSLGKAKQREYRKAGYICIDVSAGQDGSLTFLEDL